MTYDPYRQPDPTRAFQPPPQQYAQPGWVPGREPHGAPAGPPQPPQKKRPAWVAYAALAAAVVFLGSAGWFTYDRVIKKDSGVAACESLRAGERIPGAAKDRTADGKMSEAQYKQFRTTFEGSRYADLQAAGTKLMDVLWQIQGIGKDAGFAALPLVGQMMSAITDFGAACANHGVVLDTAKWTSGPADAATPADPKCSDVFKPGRVIPKGESASTCTTPEGSSTIVMYSTCRDGRRLYRPELASGAANGWGYGGDKFHAIKGSDDAAYQRAENNCY